VSEAVWDVRITDAAGADYDDILRWTLARFGPSQAAAYAVRIAAALEVLRMGPAVIGARARDEVAPGLMTLHLGRRARHIVVFRISETAPATFNVLRILHDAMDVGLHI
jgi:toxin ParE1/3/4